LRPRAAKSTLQPYTRSALYRAWERFGLSAIARTGGLMATVLIGVGAGGCSLSRTDGGFGKFAGDDVTGSIAPAAQVKPVMPTESDLTIARNAASDVLRRGDKDASQPWENPETGARGSVTPLAQAYTSEGRTCRDFLASYVNGGSENWLQGAACQTGRGQWEIQTLRPWRQS
jgi:surface antigen